MNAELEILGVKLKHYHVDAAMEIVEDVYKRQVHGSYSWCRLTKRQTC